MSAFRREIYGKGTRDMVTAVATVNDSTLGIGIYSPADATMYARLDTSTMKRSVFGSSRGEAAIANQIRSDKPVVSFIDFVQAMATSAIRDSFKVPLQRIRDAVDCAKRDHGIEYPVLSG